MLRTARRIFVSGKVQGVGYRDWAVRTARGLDLTGWVRNRSEGSVEIHAVGEDSAIDTLVDACRIGPPLARVDHIDVQADADILVKGFTKRFAA